ncbi:MAG: polysaccharide pyruvyl transferase family protein [Cyanobacteria bacterium P01_C01_bin.72]
MVKIGILTYHYSVNYGAVLQAYGLYQFLSDRGYEVEFIDYRPYQARNSNLKYLFFRGQRLINPLLLWSGIQKLRKFQRFWRSQIKLSPQTYYGRQELQNATWDYDVVITGSDEIWNIDNSMLEYGKDRTFFLDFLDGQRVVKLSYAASFGGTIELGELQEQLYGLFADFQTILVRDGNSKRLVESGGFTAAKVLDPTLIANFQQIITPPKIKQPYILLYGSFSVAQGACITALAKEKKLKIVAIGARPGKWRPPNNILTVSPEEWLGYYAGASFVFTNYFHGTIFSIIFRKPFISFDRPEKSIKVRDLLQDLKLEQRIVTQSQLENLNWDDYLELKFDTDNLNQKIARSQALLEQAVAQVKTAELVEST